jgi:hypothetical protein
VEHTRAAGSQLEIGSYWYLYPSRTGPHHQAELWVAAIRSAPVRFSVGHWLAVGTTDGFDQDDLGSYVAACVRRMDELLGHPVGICTAHEFWRRHVRFDIGDRPRWECPEQQLHHVGGNEAELAMGALAVRTRPADRGGPGIHRVRQALVGPTGHGGSTGCLHLVTRGPDETVESWQRRWLCSSAVVELQEQLVHLGALLVVDGVYGPATDAAVRAWRGLQRRDHVDGAARVSHPGTLRSL